MAAVLTLCVGNLSLCEGWQATPQARMACCENGTACPMHKSESNAQGSSAKRVISQAQANDCCAAAATSTQPSDAGPTHVVPTVTALPAIAPFAIQLPTLAGQYWRALVPLPVSPVPRHLLFSVLLV